jgi:hypothetical protein
MGTRSISFGLLACVAAAICGGCKKSEPPAPPSAAPAADLVARVHWLGKKRLAAEPNAAYFMTLWNLPESAALEAQTLDRLARALAHDTNQLATLSSTNPPIHQSTNPLASQSPNPSTPDSNTPSAPAPINPPIHQSTNPFSALRPLVDDLLNAESYLEIHQRTNQPGNLALAIRISAQRAELWETNLAAALESLTGARPVASPDGARAWPLSQPSTINSQLSTSPRHLQLSRAGDWTLLGLGQQPNPLLADFLARIQRGFAPFPPRATNFWLETDLDLRALSRALSLGWDLPDGCPKISLTAIGDGENVRTRAQLNFPKPLALQLEPWRVPTNLVHSPLTSFTAIRGFGPWLASLQDWQSLQVGEPPNQVYFWAEGPAPLTSFGAVPLPGASNGVYHLADHLLQAGNPWLATNGLGKFQRTTNADEVVWGNLPFMQPYLKSVAAAGERFVLAGLGPMPSGPRPRPPGLFEQFLEHTNLVCYDWEMTGSRVDACIYIGQFFRFVLHKAQVPPQSLSIAWLHALQARLGNTGTTINQTGSAQLSLTRKSNLGLTAGELELLVDWLESPKFPRGLNTFVAPYVPPPRQRPRTNAAPAQPK